MTRINERCERFVRLRRLFIFSKATIINIFDPASKWNNTSKIYIYIYIEFSRNIFSDDPYIFVRLFPRPRSFVTLCHLVAFSLVFRVAICIYIATVIRFFRRFFENCVYALFRNIEKFR